MAQFLNRTEHDSANHIRHIHIDFPVQRYLIKDEISVSQFMGNDEEFQVVA